MSLKDVPRKQYLSPPRDRKPLSQEHIPAFNNRASKNEATSSPSSSSESSSLTLSPSSLPPITPAVSDPNFWTVDNLDLLFRGGVPRQHTKHSRSYSEQAVPTFAPATGLKEKRSTAPVPLYDLLHNSADHKNISEPAYMSGGSDMEASRPPGRRALSQASSRSSWESRNTGPLSTSSSSLEHDFESVSSRASRASSSTPPKAFQASRTSMPPKRPNNYFDRRASAEVVGSAPHNASWARFGAGGQARQQVQNPYSASAQRMSIMGPPSSKAPLKVKNYMPRIPGEGFRNMPDEILVVMLQELKKSHLGVGSLSCATCWMRDLLSVGLSSKKWWSVAKVALYEDIQLNGCDSLVQTKKKFKMKHGTRLKLLRRTLRARPDLAGHVKSLKVPAVPETATEPVEIEDYLNLASSLIMACPNLERLPGFYPAYEHSFSRFMHAMSTRSKLREAVWIINPSPFQRQRKYKLAADSQLLTSVLAPAYLLPEQCTQLLAYHSNWPHLKTLMLHCNAGGTIDSLLFGGICSQLAELENLHVSSFPAPSFNDLALTHLPPLKRLRLDNLPGITATGLTSFASLPCVAGLTHLSLISIPVRSLPTLARMLSRLRSLTHLTILQAPAPSLPADEGIVLHPYLGSASVEYLHWEITNPYDDRATEILARAIQYDGFPALKTLRSPTDFEGQLQKLCKPRYKIELPVDRYRNLGPPDMSFMPSSQSMPNIPTRLSLSQGSLLRESFTGGFVKSSSRASLTMNTRTLHSEDGYQDYRKKAFSLLTARRLAQQRIDAALSIPKFQILIWNPEYELLERQAVGGYIGLIQSKITYSLKPDIDGMDEAVVTIDGVGGLLDDSEEVKMRDGCTGSCNMKMVVQGKKGRETSGKEHWWHTERGRWKEVDLDKFF
ncbi:hypothetical protein BJ878DRAFT_491977 [Calycina marina]|uniref:F-box domain-containing protein n=1 Tax=Calycina marina TaxID=1763456 RepID=A0A9P7Z9Z6_9HELO|nr:hypothetical protein BJ878DRAFT_491977 [Calycina marina]